MWWKNGKGCKRNKPKNWNFQKQSDYLLKKSTTHYTKRKLRTMIKEHYPFSNIGDTFYLFDSIGSQGTIKKLVAFTEIGPNKYNLGFGDYVDEGISDKAISNNRDLIKVISTVVKILYDFYNFHPDAIIEFRGVDKKRTNLYNAILKRRYDEVEPYFLIEGWREGKKEKYNVEHRYEKFEIQLKDAKFLQTILNF